MSSALLHILVAVKGSFTSNFVRASFQRLKRVADTIERAVVFPAAQTIIQRAARRQSFATAAHWQPQRFKVFSDGHQAGEGYGLPVCQRLAALAFACRLAVSGLFPKHLRKTRQKWL